MFREMKIKERMLSEEDVMRIIRSQNYGVLSVHGDDGFPYGVPVNYAFIDGRFLIHGACENSHRMDGIRRDARVCFTIVDRHDLQEEEYTTAYSSVVVFGTAAVLNTDGEKQDAMRALVRTLTPAAYAKVCDGCVSESGGYSIVAITPLHMTGKSSG